MRYVALFLFCILVTSNAYAKEDLSGKALDCTNAQSAYWVFGKIYTYKWFVIDETPLKITKLRAHSYSTYHDKISITENYKLNRKTLGLYWQDDAKAQGKCKPITPAEIEKILNKKIDKIKAGMKGNKF